MRLFQKGKAIKENSKREGNTPPETPRQKKAKGSEGRKEVPPSATPIRNQSKDSTWTTVVKRGIRKEAKRPKNDGTEKTVLAHIATGPRAARPDAFKIKKCGQSTYADILGIIKGATDLKDLHERVTRIRRTKARELLLEMDKTNVVTPELQTLVSSTLAGSAIVQALSHKKTVDIKDLDETTTAEEVAQAITSVTGPGIVTAAHIKLRTS